MTSPLALLKAAVLLLALVCVPVALGLGLCSITWTGVGLGLAVGMMGCGPLLWCIGDERCSTRQIWLGKGLLGLGLAVAALSLLMGTLMLLRVMWPWLDGRLDHLGGVLSAAAVAIVAASYGLARWLARRRPALATA